ncbi:hypothetical protein B9479_000786 [Cryptococcus floricola]|uniref:Uncharacterized protein n=1 Tax=Cryptococcus floricola TaxID=2591691 RepID=A0A5D3B888_9TREE|nr:hypothetical protein B9479_000786 [Cryptococcus floricola]
MSDIVQPRSCSRCSRVLPSDCTTRQCDRCKEAGRASRKAQYARIKKKPEARVIQYGSWEDLRKDFLQKVAKHASQRPAEHHPIESLHFHGQCVLDDGLRPESDDQEMGKTCLRRLGIFLAGVDSGSDYRFGYHDIQASKDHLSARFRCCQDEQNADRHVPASSGDPAEHVKKRRRGRRGMDRFHCGSSLAINLFPQGRIVVEAKHAVPHVPYSRVDVPEDAGDLESLEGEAGAMAEAGEGFQELLEEMDVARSALASQMVYRDPRHLLEWQNALKNLKKLKSFVEVEERAKRRGVQNDASHRMGSGKLFKYYR